MTPPIEPVALSARTRSVSVDRSERVCLNCEWYEPKLRPNRGNIACFAITTKGYCLKHEKDRGPLQRACRDCKKNAPP
ncbi:MAG: hypothetical protein LIO57_01680 [Oscillospiraceae bacterium]|nr:hypothetical protein [Oscillospiraceae bacterium]MCC8078761.1 hypothetical protein [Oscillospiraceae bacterium]